MLVEFMNTRPQSMPSLATNTSPDATLKVFRAFYKTYATDGEMNSRR